MMRYSAPASDNASNISTKWRFIKGLALPRPNGFCNFPDGFDALAWRHATVHFIDERLLAHLVLLQRDVGPFGHAHIIPCRTASSPTPRLLSKAFRRRSLPPPPAADFVGLPPRRQSDCRRATRR